MKYNLLSTKEFQNSSLDQVIKGDNNWIFIIIFILVIVFITYSGIKKHREEKTQRKSREKEVKETIKKYIKENENLKNVAVKFVDVIPRSGREYRHRDIYDVFVEFFDSKRQKIIKKKAYEIEGFAIQKKNEPKNNYLVNWNVNREFDYEKHQKFLKQKAVPSYLEIYFKSIFKKNRKDYIKKEKEKADLWHQKQKFLHSSVKKIKKEKKVFRPQKKVEDES